MPEPSNKRPKWCPYPTKCFPIVSFGGGHPHPVICGGKMDVYLVSTIDSDGDAMAQSIASSFQRAQKVVEDQVNKYRASEHWQDLQGVKWSKYQMVHTERWKGQLFGDGLYDHHYEIEKFVVVE